MMVPGVPSSYKRKVFDPYFSTKKSGTGFGFGNRQSPIISDHHGQVSVSGQQSHGDGCFFSIACFRSLKYILKK